MFQKDQKTGTRKINWEAKYLFYFFLRQVVVGWKVEDDAADG